MDKAQAELLVNMVVTLLMVIQFLLAAAALEVLMAGIISRVLLVVLMAAVRQGAIRPVLMVR
jgi:hypothetical protein